MDENEKMVLRRRRNDIADKLEANHELLKELNAHGLLSHDAVRDIEREKSNETRVTRIIDTIVFLNPPGGFNALCAVLHHASASCARLVHELESDLRLERGEVRPRQDIYDEAASIVHRKFGPSKRFSEADKREVSDLIAVKLQLSQDDWRRETLKVRTELEKLTTEIEERDERFRILTADEAAERTSRLVAALLRDFVHRHEKQMTSYAHDMTTTSDLLREIMEDMFADNQNGSLIATLERNLKTFFRQVETMLNHRDALYYEKEKCLRLLGIVDDDQKSVQLDEVVGRLTGLSVNADMSVESKDSIIARLRRQVEQLDSEADAQDQQLQQFRQEIADKEREIAELRRHVHIL